MTVFYNDTVTNIVKGVVTSMLQSYAHAKFARLKEYDPEKNLVKVAYWNPDTEDFDQMSGWLAYMTPFNGIGDDSEDGDGDLWGMQFGPNINEQVLVIPHDGDHNNGLVMGSIYTRKRPPPTLNGDFTESGEWFFMHKTGSYLKYTNDGDLFIKAKDNLRVIVDGKADITILGDCNLNVGGNVKAEIDGSVEATVGTTLIANVDGDLTANVGGSSTINSVGQVTTNTDGNMTANVGGSLQAAVQGNANIESDGALFLQSNTDIAILSRGLVNIQGNAGIILASTVSVLNIAPLAPIPETIGITVPPLPPLIITPTVVQTPRQPDKAVDTDTQEGGGTGPNAPTNPAVSNVTPNAATVDFTDPNQNG